MPRLMRSKKHCQCNRTIVHRSRLWLETLETRVVPSIFTVTNTDDSGPGSLRQAILDANADHFTDTIAFNVGGGRVQTIQPHSALPPITNHVVIDGTTQPGYAGTPLIVLNGSMAGGGADGLTIRAGFSTVQGLTINGFSGDGIHLDIGGNDVIAGNLVGVSQDGTFAVPNGYGIVCASNNNVIGGLTSNARNVSSGNMQSGIAVSGVGNLIEGNYVGTDINGIHALGNQGAGIGIGGNGNVVGGAPAGARNIISANGNDGLFLSGSNQLVTNNYIGTDQTGMIALGNGGTGVNAQLASDLTIGGTFPGLGNVISANHFYGIEALGGANDLIAGNHIGTDVAGIHGLGNGQAGIFLVNSDAATIGGAIFQAGNLISGNGADGVVLSGGNREVVVGNLIGVDVTGTTALGNSSGLTLLFGVNGATIGGTSPNSRNIISGNRLDGIAIPGASNSLIVGNSIGTDFGGTLALGNTIGIGIDGGSNNSIGGLVPGAANIISANRSDGILIEGSSGGAEIAGNYIGTNATGITALPNAGNGVSIQGGAHDNTIGGTTAASRNVISGNGGEGIRIYDNSSGTSHNSILGNYIGTNAAGTAAIGNHNSGIFIPFSQDNTIFGNLVSGNLGFAGIAVCAHSPCGGLTSSSGNASGNLITGNKVGTDVNGALAVANAGYGISIDGVGGTGIVVGGLTPAARNIISGNGSNGVYFLNNAMATVVEGNYIGTIASGAGPLPNRGDGIRLNTGSNNTIGGTAPGAGNLISGNSNAGIESSGIGSQNNLIEGNFIGTDVTGNRALSNQYGVLINGGFNDTIGGPVPGAGNLISGNGNGILLASGVQGVDHVIIQGNLIGTNAAGTAALGNMVGISMVSGNHLIGGTISQARNIISGNGAGIDIGQNLSGNDEVLGNFIGTDITGTRAIPNNTGVLLSDTSASNTIGGTLPGSANIISGNGTGVSIIAVPDKPGAGTVVGNFIGTDPTGAVALPNQVGIYVSGAEARIGGPDTAARNIISGNLQYGIEIDGSNGNRTSAIVQGNYIGTDVDGLAPLANGVGIFVLNSTSQTIRGNIISGNRLDGIDLNGNNNVVQGNLIGTDASGAVAVRNGFNGIVVFSGAHNLIGGTEPGVGNVISGNFSNGIAIGYDARAVGNVVQGNLIGTDIGGTSPIPNGDGIALVGGSQNLIGGTIAGAGNLISGNERGGLYVGSNDAGNVVEGNLIGTDINGTAALGNGYGFFFFSGANVQIIGNAISGNVHDGIFFDNGLVTGNVVQGNLIGIDASGTVPLGNGDNGINFVNDSLLGAPHDNLIGGTAPGAGNIIAYNGHDGVLVDTGTGNTILRNRILGHDNGLGIELIDGGNNNQAFPIIVSATFDGRFSTITGTLASAPNTTYTIELFVNSACNPSGFGEGEHFFASITVSTDADGNASFALSLPIQVDPGQFVSATATNPAGNTSQFAACVEVTGPGFPHILPPIVNASSGREFLSLIKASPAPVVRPALFFDLRSIDTPPSLQFSVPRSLHEELASDGLPRDPFSDLL